MAKTLDLIPAEKNTETGNYDSDFSYCLHLSVNLLFVSVKQAQNLKLIGSNSATHFLVCIIKFIC